MFHTECLVSFLFFLSALLGLLHVLCTVSYLTKLTICNEQQRNFNWISLRFISSSY